MAFAKKHQVLLESLQQVKKELQILFHDFLNLKPLLGEKTTKYGQLNKEME